MTELPNVHKLDVVAENGVPFRVVVLTDGISENYGKLNDRGLTEVEFYDRRYPHTQDGQFTGARYYFDSLTDTHGGGLMLHGGVDDWTLDSITWKTVREWLFFLVDRELVRV